MCQSSFLIHWLSGGLLVAFVTGWSAPSNLYRKQWQWKTRFRAIQNSALEPYYTFHGNVDILDRDEHYVVVSKPHSVVCHHSDWTGSKKRKDDVPEIPMLQRTRQAIGERINLVHRLDRGASGCLLFALVKSDKRGLDATKTLQLAMQNATKTYIALVRGEGILHGRDLKKEGWFEVTRPIKDEKGVLHNATTLFRFIAGQDNASGSLDRPRASLVLARPKTGRWHQIRRHLNGLSHPILGDSSHGNSKLNREWRELRELPPERTCLHLLQLEIPPMGEICPNGIRVVCPLAPDMMKLLEDHLPSVLEEALPILKDECLTLIPEVDTSTTIPVHISC